MKQNTDIVVHIIKNMTVKHGNSNPLNKNGAGSNRISISKMYIQNSSITWFPTCHHAKMLFPDRSQIQFEWLNNEVSRKKTSPWP